MTLDKLLGQCESPIEGHLLQNLYPSLAPHEREDLVAQYYIDSVSVRTRLDFAFLKGKVAIYCDGYEYHSDKEAFRVDREQSRELQLLGWVVLRFTGSEINSDIGTVVDTIQRAIKKQAIKRDYDHAIEDLTKAIQLKPDSASLIDSVSVRTRLDFAFLKGKVAIYCDGYEYHSDKEAFRVDREQSRELQLLGWVVLRFTGSEINSDIDTVVDTIQRAIKKQAIKRDYDHAIEDLTKAIQLKPDSASLYRRRGLVYQQKGDHALADEDFDKGRML